MSVSPTWAPRPDGYVTTQARSDYHAGYSDGWYGAEFGAGHDAPNSSSAYREGFRDGSDDRLKGDLP